MNWLKSVLVWGDSLLKGVVFDANSGKYTISKTSSVSCVAKKFKLDILNRSKFGCTVSKAGGIIERDLSNGLIADSALIEFGGNDCDFKWNEVADDPTVRHIPKTPLDTFKTELIRIINMLRGKKIVPVTMSIPPIDAERYFDFISRGLNRDNILKWLGDKEHIYRWHEMYSHCVSNVARETGCRYIDVRSRFLSEWNYKQYICDDGIHLNDAGQQLLGAIFSDYIGGLHIKAGLA